MILAEALVLLSVTLVFCVPCIGGAWCYYEGTYRE
jgi:hypothetical protein